MVKLSPNTQPTHKYVAGDGHVYLCIPWTRHTILAMCNDNKTWMPEPIWVGGGVHSLKLDIFGSDPD